MPVGSSPSMDRHDATSESARIGGTPRPRAAPVGGSPGLDPYRGRERVLPGDRWRQRTVPVTLLFLPGRLALGRRPFGVLLGDRTFDPLGQQD